MYGNGAVGHATLWNSTAEALVKAIPIASKSWIFRLLGGHGFPQMIGARIQIHLWSIVRTNAILPSPNRIRNVETGDLRVSLAYDCGLGILAGTSQTQYAAASARTRRDQALHGGMSQRSRVSC